MINNKALQYLIKRSSHQEIKFKVEKYNKNLINHVDLPENAETIKQFIREYMNPEKTCYVYFYNKDLIPIFTDIHIKNFNNFKITRFTKLLNNILLSPLLKLPKATMSTFCYKIRLVTLPFGVFPRSFVKHTL